MILYLFGGYSPNTEKQHWKLINTEINKIKPKQILFIGFAGLDSQKKNFNRFQKIIVCNFSTELLNAADEKDVSEAKDPLIFVQGGDGHIELFNGVTKNKKLKHLVINAFYYFGDSAGSMLVGSLQRKYGDGSPLMPGLGILKSTIVEPHYTQWDRHQQLRNELEKSQCKIGIGIDEAAAIKINPELFPKKYEVIGKNKVEVLE